MFFFNRERPLYKVITNSPFKEAYVTNTGAFSLLTIDNKFYLYDIGQKEAALLEIEGEENTNYYNFVLFLSYSTFPYIPPPPSIIRILPSRALIILIASFSPTTLSISS